MLEVPGGKVDLISPSDPREEVGTFGVLRVYSTFRLSLTSLATVLPWLR